MKKLVIILAGVVALFAYSTPADAKTPKKNKKAKETVEAPAPAPVVENTPAAPSAECMQYLSLYQSYYKQGTKDARMEAVPHWRNAYRECPPATRQNVYIHGAALYRMLIKENNKNVEYRKALVDTLITLDQLRIKYYAEDPKYTKAAYDALCSDVNNYIVKTDPEQAYKILSEVIEKQGVNVDPVAFLAQMNSAVALYKEDKLTAEEVINNYDYAVTCFTEIQKTDDSQNTKNLRTTMENAFINSRIASCENLIELFGDRFEANKDDYAMVSKIVKLMGSAEDCTDNDLFLKAVTAMHKLQPNSNSAYYLYRLNASKSNTSLAIKYLEEACSDETLDASTKGQYNYEMAAFCLKSGHVAKAIEAANKAIAADDSYAGKAYMIIGHAWLSVSCGGNEIEKRAKYWVATDYFNKAKAADNTLTEDANRQISNCATYYPQKAEAFMYDLQAGNPFTVSCGGLKANTTVRVR